MKGTHVRENGITQKKFSDAKNIFRDIVTKYIYLFFTARGIFFLGTIFFFPSGKKKS